MPFKRDGYTFIEIEAIDAHRPYRVKCLETGETKDSALSINDAVALLIQPMKFAESMLQANSENEEYIRRLFSQWLVGQKKSQCDNLVTEHIVNRNAIAGLIEFVPEKDKGERFKDYITETFIVRVHFEHGPLAGATRITVQKRYE